MKTLFYFLLSCLILFSIITGFLLIMNPDGQLLGLDKNILHNTPFKNFVWPGMILVSVVTTFAGLAIFYSPCRVLRMCNAARIAAAALILWIIIADIYAGAVYWHSFMFSACAVWVYILSVRYEKKWFEEINQRQ
ncbi:hypothetical protein [Ferruginibacter sp. HRS2-29]|uniref:hypothetical protein n=1 Tax=Ferruginibacter sp. HRS2-29 TaxID=2487334 RepID=UPI0020CB9F49|nr:hypothetical protein [Ferruginibacter sp. HRS2-29]MCP9753147.1 hypothetical protein [Ferruginibacter sp. HRS2-29]